MTRKRKEQVTYHKGQIPPPQFIIFYNGQEERPDSQVLRLSDMYAAEEETHKLDLEAKMLNINAGHNPELMDACQIAVGVCRIYRPCKEICKRDVD